MMRLLYDLGVWLYSTGIRIKSISDNKARKWIAGRRNWRKELRTVLSDAPKERIWMHCASLGEFEQGRPVLDELRNKYPQYWIFLTFFSPSGYEVRKNYENADHVSYLPIDSRKNAEAFIDILNPTIALFVKYEFWYHYLDELQQRKIPVILFSAIFRQDQVFFKWYGGLFRKMLSFYSQVFVQDQTSQILLNELNIDTVSIASDTRFDRVYQIANSVEELPTVKEFCHNQKTVIGGSTWSHDLPVFKKLDFTQNKLIIAPHDLSESKLKEIEHYFSVETIRYSNVSNVANKARIMIIDNIGLLAAIYKYGEVAYVGGGFGEGIHNTLEPAVHGIPVLFGPNYHKFREAQALINKKAAYSSRDKSELADYINHLLTNEKYRKSMGTNAGTYVREQRGGTKKVLNEIERYL